MLIREELFCRGLSTAIEQFNLVGTHIETSAADAVDRGSNRAHREVVIQVEAVVGGEHSIQPLPGETQRRLVRGTLAGSLAVAKNRPGESRAWDTRTCRG